MSSLICHKQVNMKRCLALLGCASIVLLMGISCNKKCVCTTTVSGFDTETIAYEKPGKHACKGYEESQNTVLTDIGGQVKCVYE